MKKLENILAYSIYSLIKIAVIGFPVTIVALSYAVEQICG